MFLQALTVGLAATAFATPVVKRAIPSGVPDFAVKYAPMVYLDTAETYFPSDLGAQLQHTHPDLNYTAITNGPKPLTLDNLGQLNSQQNGGRNVYLTANDDPATNPAWLNGVKPDATGKTEGAVSCGIIVVDKGSGIVDVFYMYFYAFNYGGTYYGLTVDDHVGDWEHMMVRFNNSQPQDVWYSQHSFGEAFTYAATEKYKGGVRPVGYSANGTHANYAINGTHDHTIPNHNLPKGPIEDHTSNGPIWDPTLSAYYVKYDPSSNKFTAYDSSTPTSWLDFLGKWGDEMYPKSDKRQFCLFDITALCKWTSGPTGPIDKDLGRTNVCPSASSEYKCTIQTKLGP